MGFLFALISACAPPTPLEGALKTAIIKSAESICNINTADAVTFCIGIRDGVDGGDPREAYHAGAGFIRDPDKSFIRMLQREMIRGNPIFKTISECGGMDCAKEGGRHRITIEYARILDARHARVDLAEHWDVRAHVYATFYLERGDHGWRVTNEP